MTTRKTLATQKRATAAQMEIIRWIRNELRDRVGSWAGYKRKVMDRLNVPRQAFYDWDVPIDYQYAFMRSRDGATHKDVARQLSQPTGNRWYGKEPGNRQNS
jgi:nitrate reductase beta subunit